MTTDVEDARTIRRAEARRAVRYRIDKIRSPRPPEPINPARLDNLIRRHHRRHRILRWDLVWWMAYTELHVSDGVFGAVDVGDLADANGHATDEEIGAAHCLYLAGCD